MNIRLRPITFLIVFLIVSAVYILSPTIVTNIPVETLYLVFPVVAALVGVYASGVYGIKSANGRAQLLITAGLVIWAIAETVSYISDDYITSDNLAPQTPDFIFLSAFPILCAGIYQGYTTAGIKLKQVKRSLLIGVSLTSLVLTILVAYFGVYQAYDSSADLLQNVVNIGYGIGDLVLVIASMLTILVANEYGNGKLASFWKTMGAGFFVFLIGDILFYTMYGDLMAQDIKPYTYIELIWLAGYLLFTYAIIENYMHILSVQINIRIKLQQRNQTNTDIK